MTLRLFLLPALPLLAALGLSFAHRLAGGALAAVAASVALVVTAIVLSLGAPILGGEVLVASVPWIPSAGLDLSFYADGLSWLFLLLISGVGTLVIGYAAAYMRQPQGLARFYASLLLFMAAMLGIVTAGNLLFLVVFWELTSISSFLLIGFRDDVAAARAGAYQALIVTGMGGLALLAGVLVLGQAAGTFDLAELLARAAEVGALPAAPAALVLILLGAFTKSAQVPFHFWLPSAMAAPTPVSAYLHSATMVKAGIFLLARLSPLFVGSDLWFYALTGFGAATMLTGGYGALRQTDLKALLAYSTISQLGLIVMLLGCSGELAAVAATFHILNHALFKAPLFMAAGIVDHEVGSRDLRQLGGLVSFLPRTALIVCVGGAAMTGVPLLNGFLSKELFYEAMLAVSGRGWWGALLPWIAVAGSTLTVAYTLRLILGAFFGGSRRAVPPHEAPWQLRYPAEFLILACFVIGVLPAWLAGALVDAAAGAVVGRVVHAHLAVWHGWNLALAMSAVASAGGIAYYAARQDPSGDPRAARLRHSAGEIYDLGVAQLIATGASISHYLQGGDLRIYVRRVLIFTMAMVLPGIALLPPTTALLSSSPSPPGATLLAVLTSTAALAIAVLNRRRLPSVIALAAVGLLIAVYFVWLSAPDLVITQLLVETVSTILILLVLHFLPRPKPPREPRSRLIIDAGLSLAVGLCVGGVVLAVLGVPFDSISAFHIAESLEQAGGRNVVNVILVDFRGYDTLGEITVLAIAAIGVVALTRAERRAA